MIITNADRIFAQNWVEQYRTNFYNDPDNAHMTALQFLQPRNAREAIGDAFYWSRTPEDEVWFVRRSHLFQSWELLAR
jgi:uncharacterized protein (DUF427 family)